MIIDAPHDIEVHPLQSNIFQRGPNHRNKELTKYPVSSVSGRKMMVARVNRRLSGKNKSILIPNSDNRTHITSFVSYEAIYIVSYYIGKNAISQEKYIR